MASTNQKYLDTNLYVTAEFTSGQDCVPAVIIDPSTNDYWDVTNSVIDNFVQEVKYMPAVVIDPDTGEPEKI